MHQPAVMGSTMQHQPANITQLSTVLDVDWRIVHVPHPYLFFCHHFGTISSAGICVVQSFQWAETAHSSCAVRCLRGEDFSHVTVLPMIAVAL